jgi:CDP-4-dehydro-6-deoxyglucose reductase, E1
MTASKNQSSFPLASDSWGAEEKLAMARVIESGQFTMGREVRDFERSVAAKFGADFAVMVNSGSSANLIMLTALQILYGPKWPESPEVLVPAVSWSTTFTPFYFLNLKPVFVDVDRNHFGIDTSKLEGAITENTVAILAVNILGQPAELDALSRIAETRGLVLLEDNCESLGATLGGKFTGTFGLASSHSSFFSHHISTMEGGWICTDDEEFYLTCMSLRAHGWVREQPEDSFLRAGLAGGFDSLFHFVLPGLNFRPLELEAAVGLEQLKKFNAMQNLRLKNNSLFRSLFNQSENVRLQTGPGESSSFALPIVLTGGLAGHRKEITEALSDAGVECRPIIAGNFARQPVMKFLGGRVESDLTNADELHFDGFYIGNHPRDLTPEIHHAWRVFNEVETTITGKKS